MESRFLLLYLIAAVAVSGFLMPWKAAAVSPSSILVDVSPQNPAPAEKVNISVSSYASNLDSVNISWLVGGKVVSSGIGQKSFSVSAPEAGKDLRVVAKVALPDGTIEKVINIRPNVMVLLWQATDSYVPPFYRGKALPTPGSEVRVVAIPEIKSGEQTLSPKNLVYAWKKDYTNDQNASGYGKDYFTYVNDYLDDSNNISVIASTTDQKLSSQATQDIGTFQPKIVFYKNDLAMGILWEQALENGHNINGEEILAAIPYYISPKNLWVPSLSWIWSINDIYIEVAGVRQNVLPLKVQDGISGLSKIKLEVSNKYKLFETAQREITVQF